VRFSIKAYLQIIFIASLFLPIKIYGKNKNENDPLIISGQWEIVRGVEKLFTTPLGGVYRFKLSNLDGFKSTKNIFKAPKINTLQFDLWKNKKRPVKLYRYIIVDFKFRSFPAIDKCRN